jgi:hypothetical protein
VPIIQWEIYTCLPTIKITKEPRQTKERNLCSLVSDTKECISRKVPDELALFSCGVEWVEGLHKKGGVNQGDLEKVTSEAPLALTTRIMSSFFQPMVRVEEL